MPMRALISFFVAMLIASPIVIAQSDAPLIAASISDSSARAWTIYQNTQDENILVLIAPRNEVSGTRVPIEAAPPGQVQAMRALGSRDPLAIAAIGDRVYLVYPPTYAESTRLMRVYSATALPGSVGGLWVIDPPTRLDAEPAIRGEAVLVDLQATRDTLYALLNDDGTARLLQLQTTDWVDIELPDSINTRRLDLVAMGDRLALVDRSGPAFAAHVYDATTLQWTPLPDTLPIGLHTQLIPGERAIGALDWDEDQTARLRVWSESGIFQYATQSGPPADARYALLDSSDTLVGVRTLPADPENPEQGTVELLEYDARTLAERFRGPPVASAPVTPEEFRFLVGMMMLIMLGVLVVVILPDRTDAMSIPESCVLADPGRRLIATMLDAVIVASLVGWAFDVSASEILTLAVIVRPDNAWAVIPITIITGLTMGTLGEWLLGLTPGKLLMGLRVVRAQPDVVQHPRFWSALVRNIVKWVLPPVAALALIDPETLHRGDRASRSLVVMPRPTPLPPADDQG